VLIIFDFDGVIALNTEEITMDVIAKLVQDRLIDKSEKLNLNRLIGLSGGELVRKIMTDYNTTITDAGKFEKLIMTTRMERMKIGGALKKDPSLVDFLEFLDSRRVKYLVATSSSLPPVEIALTSLDLAKYFNVSGANKNVFSMDDFPNFSSKYQLYGWLKERCFGEKIFVIEDSVNGISAARKAGVENIILYGSMVEIEGVIYAVESFRELKTGLF
jgi:beta-phosphoglucomutase-like phosphatase (HAD superfamily)